MTRIASRFLCIGLAAWAVACGSDKPPREEDLTDAGRLQRDLAWLADDARQGRGLGTGGLQETAQYLALGFDQAGLRPGAPEGGYLQRFEMPVFISIEWARFEINGVPLDRNVSFEPFLNSENGRMESAVVFAGYGITDEDAGYDDYAGIDVTDRIVLVLDHRPDAMASAARSPEFLRRAYKILNARRHGARAILVAPSVAGLEGLPGAGGRRRANPLTESSGIVTAAVSRDTAARILTASGLDLDAVQAEIDETGKPQSRLLHDVSVGLEVRVARPIRSVSNVIGVLPGTDPFLSKEAVVIGAHYDHLGSGEFGSLTPDRFGEIHNGADDNASGTAGLLALARRFGAGAPTRRTLVLVAFTAEEAGLVGSGRYVRSPSVDIEDTVAMLNLDMVGRLEDDPLIVFGSESSPGFRELVESENGDGLLTLNLTDSGAYGPSDQTTFYAKGVPVLFFFTGAHSTYHTPDDDVDGLDVEGELRVLRLVERTARALLNAPARPAVVTAPAPKRGAPGGGGYGPSLGTIPAFGGEPVRGVRLQGVRAGSPAEQAGIRAGDVLIEFDGAPIENLEEFAALLRTARAGEAVEMVLLRDGETVHVRAILGQR